jgi:hypothetical protein
MSAFLSLAPTDRSNPDVHVKRTRVLIDVALALSPVLVGCVSTHPLDWASGLEPGWQFLESGGPPWSASFVRPDFTVGAQGHRFGRMRVEYEKARPALSTEIWYEVDCQGGRSRTLETVHYSQRNAQGRVLERRSELGEWYSAPDDLNVFLPYACANTPAERQAALTGAFPIPDPKLPRMKPRGNLDPDR